MPPETASEDVPIAPAPGRPASATAIARLAAAVGGWSRSAWAAIALVVLFAAVSAWWLTQDGRLPNGDAGEHLLTVYQFHDWLRAGQLFEPLLHESVYPPLTQLVGALAVFVGGRSVITPVLAQNIVYLSLLALACYRIGRLAYGSRAGLLAVVVVVGAPLLIEQFHVFMLDAPLAALVAVTVWLLLESDRFANERIAALAGVVAGLGCISKQQFPLYVFGVILVLLWRGGWRPRRGHWLFLGIAFAIAAPWYALHFDDLDGIGSAALAGETVPKLASPPLVSLANVEWYLWATLNGLLFAPLFAIVAIGVVKAVVDVARGRAARFVPELLGGLLGAWLAITAMPHKDLRYTMQLTVFLAVLGTGWIVGLARSARLVATAALLLAIAATTLGMTFGVGGSVPALLPGSRAAPDGEGVPPLRTVVVYSNHDFLVSGPRRSGDVLRMLKALRAAGVGNLRWPPEQASFATPEFNHNGLVALARIAELRIPEEAVSGLMLESSDAFLIRQPRLGRTPPCVRLDDGTGIWVRLGDPRARGVQNFCPLRRPAFYGP